VIGCDEGHMPHWRRPGDPEERRIFFVAVTRAKDRLLLTYPEVRPAGQSLVATAPSRFLRAARHVEVR